MASSVRRLISWRYRQATWSLRAFPDFLIIGAQKAGTTSLYYYLTQHRQIFGSFRKEVHFFDGGLDPGVNTFAKGEKWYRAHFPARVRLVGGAKSFEASPIYLFNPIAAARIARLMPSVKLVTLLRNPADRAISHYLHEKRRGHETLPMLDAFLEEENRLNGVWASGNFKDHAFIHHSYKSRGLYREQLRRYLENFRREQLLVLNSEDLFQSPGTTLERVFDFVGVGPDSAVRDLQPRNTAGTRGEVSPDVSQYLEDYFRPHNDALYELLGRDFGWQRPSNSR